jgi:hypothetical protein
MQAAMAEMMTAAIEQTRRLVPTIRRGRSGQDRNGVKESI